MEQSEIICMAREACAPNQTFNSDEEWVKRFAALVAAHEREACAKSVYDSTDWAHEERDMVLKEAIAAAIRARGEK